jgi:hypothetical protein
LQKEYNNLETSKRTKEATKKAYGSQLDKAKTEVSKLEAIPEEKRTTTWEVDLSKAKSEVKYFE